MPDIAVDIGVRVFAALTGVRPGPDLVHRHRERLVRLRRKRSKRHRGADETLDDHGRGLDLVDVDGAYGRDGHQVSQRLRSVHPRQAPPLAVRARVAFLRCLLRSAHSDRVVRVVLAGFSETHPAVIRQRSGHLGDALAHHLVDVGEVGAADAGGHAREAPLHYLGAEAERLEHMSASIAGRRGDAHLRHHLQQPRVQSFAVGGLPVWTSSRERKVWMDGRGADRDQASHVMNIDDVTGDGNDVTRHPGSGSEQMLVNRADRERHRYGRARRVELGAAIAEGDDALHLAGLEAQPLELVCKGTVRSAGGIQHRGLLEHARELAGTEHRRLNLEEAVLAGYRGMMPAAQLRFGAALRLEGARPRAEKGAQGHHRLLSQGIDRRVGHLRESLAQVAIDPARCAAERCDRDVVAHRVDRLGGGLGHDPDHHLHVLETPSMDALEPPYVLWRVDLDVAARDRDEGAVREQAVLVARGRPLLGVRVAQDGAIAGVDEQHLARPEAAALDDILGSHRHDTGFRGSGHKALARPLPPERPQPVPVQRRPNHVAVAERQRRGAVPRFELGRLISVEVAHRGGHVAAALPRVGHEAHERLRDLPAAAHQELERIVERGRVRSVRPDRSSQLRLELRLPGAHPCAVGADCVDLSVVRQQPEGLGQTPVRHGVGRVALVENGQPALAGGVLQVEVEVGQLGAGHEALVDDGAARARRDVHPNAFVDRPHLGPASREVEASFPLVRLETGSPYQAVPDRRHRLQRPLAEA